jgi:type I restriction enzyme S subunit
MPRASNEQISNLFLQLPPLPEQRAIASFLDQETTSINALIAKKERLIELLREKRTALISHTVTKGLDSTVPMKDSVVEWLGEIPGHWEMKRIRDVTELLQTGPFGSQLHSSDYVSNGIPVINPSHLKDGRIYPDWDCTVDDEIGFRLVRHALYEGDIVFARRGEMGRCALVTEIEVGWLCGTGSLLMRPRVTLTVPSFLSKVLSTNGVKDWLLLESVGSTMDNLNTSILSRIPLPIPPLSEQQSIVNYLNQETVKIDALISRIEEGIEKLKEYSTALISAAVTGKIDVRGETGIADDEM